MGCGPTIDERSMSSRATVLPSSFSSRWVVVGLVTVATGSRAAAPTRPPIRDATGPSGRSDIRCGRVACQPIAGWVVGALPGTASGLALAGPAGLPTPAGLPVPTVLAVLAVLAASP